MADVGMICAIHRTAEEWAQHPEGKHLVQMPVLDIEKVGDAAPISYKADPTQPFSGIKALSLY